MNAIAWVCLAAAAIALFIVLPLAVTSTTNVHMQQLQQQQALLEQMMEQRATEKYAGNDDSISWQECQTLGTDACAYRRVMVKQKDFAHGTLRIKHPCMIYLGEDITFSPNYNYDHRVSSQQRSSGEYPHDSGFVLGFFAALSLESHHIVVDLNGFTLKVSEIFAAKQSFYAHIELANAPFIPNDGPASFGSNFYAAHHVIIRNGKLHRSSHHGIHGNGAKHVYIYNLEIKDYEVAAIALNGCEGVCITDVKALGTVSYVPELGSLSQARFILPFMERLADQDDMVKQSLHRLSSLCDQAAHDIEYFGKIDKDAHPEAYKLFANTHGIADGGSSYGIIITDFGSAVHAFGISYRYGEGSRSVMISNTLINGTLSNAIEVIATRRVGDNTPFAGPAGDIVNFERVMLQYNGKPIDDPLTHAQLALASAVDLHVAEKDRGLFPTLFVVKEIIDWFRATNGGRSSVSMQLENLFEAKKIHYTRRGDAMNHFSKGSIGLRLDSSASIYLSNVRIDHTIAEGDAGKTYDLPGESHEEEEDHPQEAPFTGYHGNVATAVLLAGCVDVNMPGIDIGIVYSRTGAAYKVRDVVAIIRSKEH